MLAYQQLITDILQNGSRKTDRTSTGTVSLFGATIRHDLQTGFPATTTKKFFFDAMAGELACFVKGLTEIEEFQKRGCKIWNANLLDFNRKHHTPDNTNLGPVYGAQWRNFGGVDQLRLAINIGKREPDSRRMLVSAWNPAEMPSMVLPPCHYAFQIYINNGALDLLFTMRSVDIMIGLPFDLASYALLAHLIANELKLIPGNVIGHFGDAHIYINHLNAAHTVLERRPLPLPGITLHCKPGMPVEQFEPAMAELFDYVSHSAIKLEMAV